MNGENFLNKQLFATKLPKGQTLNSEILRTLLEKSKSQLACILQKALFISYIRYINTLGAKHFKISKPLFLKPIITDELFQVKKKNKQKQSSCFTIILALGELLRKPANFSSILAITDWHQITRLAGNEEF